MSSPGTEVPLDLVTPIFAQSFARVDRAQARWTPICPICLVGNPSEEEHVPQYPLGGSVMTMTCAPCNNRLRSRVESELEHWFDNALIRVRFAHEDVRGPRRARRVLYLRNSQDPQKFALFPEGDLAPEIEEMFKAGSFWLHFREPDPRRFKLAAL
jgi:hypothetical protein